MKSLTAARLTVDLDALAANYAFVSSVAAGVELAPVVKANAYGLGLKQISLRLYSLGVRSFFVARVAEGEALRGILGDGSVRIYVLDGCAPGGADRLVAARLIPVLNSLDQLSDYSAGAPRTGLDAALHIDTGLNRLGVTESEAAAIAAATDRTGRVEIGLVISHLASAASPRDPMNERQRTQFASAAALFPRARRSLANSGGVFLGDRFHLDLVRSGVALYGGGPFGVPDHRLSAVATFEAPVLQLRSVRQAETIGYGAAFTADRPMRIAIVAAGYADGVLRASGGDGYGVFQGHHLPFVGRVSMDLIAMDATEAPGLTSGDAVELLGPNALLDDVAARAGTIAYEFLVRLGGRSGARV